MYCYCGVLIGVVVSSRPQWILLHIGEERFGFLNVYAPNTASNRDEFWTTIEASLLADHECERGPQHVGGSKGQTKW